MTVPKDDDAEHDPTRVTNQPALTVSTGREWLLVGALFALVSLVPLVSLIFISPGRSFPYAVTTAVVVVLCYLWMLVERFTQPPGRRRLRMLATAMITMAALGLVGVALCAVVEAST